MRKKITDLVFKSVTTNEANKNKVKFTFPNFIQIGNIKSTETIRKLNFKSGTSVLNSLVRVLLSVRTFPMCNKIKLMA